MGSCVTKNEFLVLPLLLPLFHVAHLAELGLDILRANFSLFLNRPSLSLSLALLSGFCTLRLVGWE